MKRKIVMLLVVPILIMAVQLNEGATIWTHDEGFFQQYRQIDVRAIDVGGDVVIWGKEPVFPTRELFFDPINHSLIATFDEFDLTLIEHLDATNIFLKSDMSSGWGTSSITISGYIANTFSFHESPMSPFNHLVAATGAGVFESADGGNNWGGVNPSMGKMITSFTFDAVISPVLQTSSLPWARKYFASIADGVYQRTIMTDWRQLPGIIGDNDFEDADPGNLDSLPEGWTQTGVEDEYRFVQLDTINSYSGLYSLLIHSSAVGGDVVAARYGLPDVPYLVCKFQLMPDYHSGIIEIKNGMGLKIAFRYGEMSYYTTEGWVVIEGADVDTGAFNGLGFILDIENGSGVIITPSSMDTIELYQADNTVPEVVFSTESSGAGSQPYWIDDFYVSPMVYSLAPHTDSVEYVYAGTPLGVYSYDGSEWSKSLDKKDEWNILKTDLEGNYLVVGSPTSIYRSDDGGGNWTDISGNLPAINDIYVDTTGVVYAATDSFPYKYDGSWSQMNNGFLDYGIMKQVKVCEAITLVPPDTIVVGNHNGIYVSVDGGANWVEGNEGIDPYLIDSATIAEVDEYLEDKVPSDSTTGLLELLTDEIGPIPDVDNDTLLHIVLLDIYEDGADATSSYFDPVNEDTTGVEHSNEMEMIYVDVPSWSPGAKNSIARDLTEMIEWNYDEDEHTWIVNGFQEYGVYLANIGSDTIEYGCSFSTANLTTHGTLPYLWIQYLRDEFGDAILDELNLCEGRFLDPQTGLYHTRILQGIEAIDSVLTDESPGNFVDAFTDWAISCYLDSLDHLKDISGFDAVLVSAGSISEKTQPYYSAGAYRITDTSPLFFSGNDENDFNLHIVRYEGTGISVLEVDAASFSEPGRNIHEIDLGVDSFDLIVEVISTNGSHPASAYFNLSLDQTKDNVNLLGILQSPLADRFLRIYYYTETRRLLDAGVEGGYVIFGSDTSELSLMTSSSPEGYRIYYGDIVLPPGDGVDTLYFLSEDISSNQYKPSYAIAKKTIGVKGGYIVSADNKFSVDIPSNGFSRSYNVTVCNTGNGYFVGPSMNLNKKAVLTFDISDKKSENLSIYRKEGDSWFEVPCTRRGDKLEAEISALGTYKVMDGDLVTNLPATLQLYSNSLNSFSINYAIPQKGPVRLDVFNALGQRVKTLIDRVVEPGYYYVEWNGRSGNNESLSNGIYFYRLSASGKRLTRKMVLVR